MISVLGKILPSILVFLTRHSREKVNFEFKKGLWVHNCFRFYEMIFWRRSGVRLENASHCSYNCITGKKIITYQFFTWESLLAHLEATIRGKIPRKLPFKIYIPTFATPVGPIFASPYLFAVAFDQIDVDNQLAGPTSGPLSWTSPSISSSNPTLIVGSWVIDTTNYDRTSGVTFNSVSQTFVNKTDASFSAAKGMAVYGSSNPSSGAHTISISYGSSVATQVDGSSVSYSGTKTTGFPDVQTTQKVSSVTSFDSTLTVATTNSWVVLFGNSQHAITASTNCTSRFNDGGNRFIFDTNAAEPTGNITQTVTIGGGASNCCTVQIAVAPTGGIHMLGSAGVGR